MIRKPLSSVLVKPAGPDCNLACSYCFYSCKSELFPGTRHRMSEPILTELIRQIMAQSGETLSISWQGGEPTLMGLPFFQKAVDLMQRFGRNQAVGNGLQTNGLLIDKGWARFLKRFDFLVGLSLDGPRHIHDRHRLAKDGNGTFALVRDRAKLMLDEGAAVNAVSVVTGYSADFPEEIYAFFKGLGLPYMQFIPYVEADSGNPLCSISPDKYGSFLCTLFDLWISDFREGLQTTSIRFFDSLLHSYIGLTPPECSLLEECGTYVVVEHNGDVFPCDFFVDPRWRLGNIAEGVLADLLNSEKQKLFGGMKKNLPEACRSCPWLKYCAGGCTKQRSESGADGRDRLCGAYLRFFEHADTGFKALAAVWKAMNAPRTFPLTP